MKEIYIAGHDQQNANNNSGKVNQSINKPIKLPTLLIIGILVVISVAVLFYLGKIGAINYKDLWIYSK